MIVPFAIVARSCALTLTQGDSLLNAVRLCGRGRARIVPRWETPNSLGKPSRFRIQSALGSSGAEEQPMSAGIASDLLRIPRAESLGGRANDPEPWRHGETAALLSFITDSPIVSQPS